jgi:hypothetical protein
MLAMARTRFRPAVVEGLEDRLALSAGPGAAAEIRTATARLNVAANRIHVLNVVLGQVNHEFHRFIVHYDLAVQITYYPSTLTSSQLATLPSGTAGTSSSSSGSSTLSTTEPVLELEQNIRQILARRMPGAVAGVVPAIFSALDTMSSNLNSITPLGMTGAMLALFSTNASAIIYGAQAYVDQAIRAYVLNR